MVLQSDPNLAEMILTARAVCGGPHAMNAGQGHPY
jgi:hypothetical protein